MLARPLIKDGGQVREVMPGDVLAGGETVGSLATVGAGTITAALIAQGIISRTGAVAAFTDTTDTANNIILGLAGNNNSVVNVTAAGTTTLQQAQPDVVPGSTFRLLYQNQLDFLATLAAGEGVTLSGLNNIPNQAWVEYLVKVNNSTPRVSLQVTNLTASKVLTLSNPQPLGTITPGMSLSGTNITTGTLVVGITQNGSGQISGVTTDTNSTGANATSVAIVFSPQVNINGIRMGLLATLPVGQFTTDATGTKTAAAGDLSGSDFTVYNNTANGAIALTTRTGALMAADLPNLLIGQSYMLRIVNAGNNTITLTAAATGITLTGTATVLTNTWREWIVTLTAAATFVFQTIGTGVAP